MTILDLLDEMDGMEPEVASDKVVDHLMGLSKAKLRDELSPIVSAFITMQMRVHARAVEDAAINPRSVAPSPDAVPYDPLAARRAFFASKFATGDNERVTWAEAGIDAHASRAEMMHKKALGHVRDASRHERAIEIIQRKGVTCLGDIKNFDPRELDQ